MKLGNIFEVRTKKGNAYLHYIFDDVELGGLIRVLPGLYDERPGNLDDITMMKERYTVFFPVLAAKRRKVIEHVGHYPANGYRKPKYMRSPHSIRGEFRGWHIVDTDTWSHTLVQTLTPAKKHLSPWGVWSDMLLIERLEQDWVLENWHPGD